MDQEMNGLKEWLIYQKELCEKSLKAAVEEKSDYTYWSGRVDSLSKVLDYIKE